MLIVNELPKDCNFNPITLNTSYKRCVDIYRTVGVQANLRYFFLIDYELSQLKEDEGNLKLKNVKIEDKEVLAIGICKLEDQSLELLELSSLKHGYSSRLMLEIENYAVREHILELSVIAYFETKDFYFECGFEAEEVMAVGKIPMFKDLRYN